MSILIKNINEIYTLSDKGIIKNGNIIIENNKIKNVGEHLPENPENYDQIIDARGMMALPGLINTHTHAAMTLLRGYADDMPLQKWLEEKIWPFESRLNSDDIYWGTMLAIVEMIKTGTTVFTDMYFQMDRVGEAVCESGIRGVLSQGLIEANDGQKGLQVAADFTEKWDGRANGRISTMMGPHATYTCSEDYLKKVVKVAADLQVPINIHVAETGQEVNIIRDKYNTTPVKFLNNLGLFSEPVVAVHCVHVNEEDIKILSDKKIGVAHNPMSNAKLSSGIAPIKKMLAEGIIIGLGTDGVSSNNNLDLVEEARFASYLQKVKNMNPTVLNIEELLEMLTINGARILKLKQLGRLEKGYLADIVLIDIKNNVTYYPDHNNLSNLLYAGKGQDVDTVIIDGKLVMKNREILTIDEKRVYTKVNEQLKHLI